MLSLAGWLAGWVGAGWGLAGGWPGAGAPPPTLCIQQWEGHRQAEGV